MFWIVSLWLYAGAIIFTLTRKDPIIVSMRKEIAKDKAEDYRIKLAFMAGVILLWPVLPLIKLIFELEEELHHPAPATEETKE